jgi:hypothetical protein
MNDYIDPPAFLNILYPIFMTVVLLVTTLIFMILTWAIIYKSPKEMQGYKWFILAYVINIFVVELFLCLLQPRFFLHNYVFAVLGKLYQKIRFL